MFIKKCIGSLLKLSLPVNDVSACSVYICIRVVNYTTLHRGVEEGATELFETFYQNNLIRY